jgi:Rps23 Pro-64 3,4-dihydroxylase Tpa1-like proline 4-hydroxylase
VTRELFTLNPELDRERLAAEFQEDGRIQVRDFLTHTAAAEIRDILGRATPWELAWQAGTDGPNAVRAADVRTEQAKVALRTADAARRGEYAFQYARYPMLDAYLDRRAPGGPHDLLLEHINSEDFLSFIRQLTGIDTIMKGDAQATLYAPGHFLGRHIDSHVAEGWRVAYVMNFCIDEWKPDWGGYLNFLDEEGDVVAGYRPRFNALNMFTVPRPHAVTFVPPFAPIGRYAITGWFRDR